MALIHAIPDIVFQSTPSAWRETTFTDLERQSQGISIHSLRMEGDPQLDILDATGQHFNPLPPHGGRQKWFCIIMGDYVFQSTPSAWRETCRSQEEVPRMVYFNPLPPHGGRPMNCHITMKKVLISIHSLRMEGDEAAKQSASLKSISIHSLRMEGDDNADGTGGKISCISIHSLRMEGDSARSRAFVIQQNFNPLPPHGGRPYSCS